MTAATTVAVTCTLVCESVRVHAVVTHKQQANKTEVRLRVRLVAGSPAASIRPAPPVVSKLCSAEQRIPSRSALAGAGRAHWPDTCTVALLGCLGCRRSVFGYE